MSLPKLGVPYYSLTLPSGNNVQYRPFTVKEEKVLLIANESKNQKNITNAIKNVLNSCVLQEQGKQPPKIEDMPIFDAEMLFLHIRMKSVGEYSEFKYRCEECEGSPEIGVRIDLRNIVIENSDKIKSSKKIMLTDEIGVELQFPTFDLVLSENKNENNSLMALEVIKKCIVSIFNPTEIYTRKDFVDAELDDFVDSLTQEQVNKISSFFENMPKLTYELKFECPCGEVSTRKLTGLSDFFS